MQEYPMLTRHVFLFLCCLSTAVLADGVQIQVKNAWIQAVPPVAEATAAYMKIKNLSPSSIRLIGASSPVAEKVEPMVTTRQQRNGQEVLGMESVDYMEIPSGGSLDLKPGGNHLMIMGLTSHPKEGEQVKLTLRFAPGDQRIDVDLPVVKQEPK
ncbi:MAG: copper chaperone PCu(A)C [Verrucomicrobia bacterium]|nr:copper chaperone PCu(A)C [Verrucomicrobiota bacterium]